MRDFPGFLPSHKVRSITASDCRRRSTHRRISPKPRTVICLRFYGSTPRDIREFKLVNDDSQFSGTKYEHKLYFAPLWPSVPSELNGRAAHSTFARCSLLFCTERKRERGRRSVSGNGNRPGEKKPKAAP